MYGLGLLQRNYDDLNNLELKMNLDCTKKHIKHLQGKLKRLQDDYDLDYSLWHADHEYQSQELWQEQQEHGETYQELLQARQQICALKTNKLMKMVNRMIYRLSNKPWITWILARFFGG